MVGQNGKSFVFQHLFIKYIMLLPKSNRKVMPSALCAIVRWLCLVVPLSLMDKATLSSINQHNQTVRVHEVADNSKVLSLLSKPCGI